MHISNYPYDTLTITDIPQNLTPVEDGVVMRKFAQTLQ